MPTALAIVLSLAIGYFLGSIPFAAIVGHFRGTDILKVDTGNPGAANVYRRLGKRYGLLVGVADMGKAALAVLVARWLGLSPSVAMAAGAAAILGHWYSPFLHFRGGAGLAAAVGVGFGVIPDLAAIGVTSWALITLATRNVGYSAGGAYVVVLIVAFALPYPIHYPAVLVLGSVGAGMVVLARALWKDKRAARKRDSAAVGSE
jgi:glycerol-3-phosphate acyltransferase PlsY